MVKPKNLKTLFIYEDFFAMVESYLDGCLVAKRREDIDRFISGNTWEARYKQITKVLQS